MPIPLLFKKAAGNIKRDRKDVRAISTVNESGKIILEGYPIGLEKYKYNPKFMPIPMETNGIVHIDEKNKTFTVHDLTKDSEFPTNVDISEWPYEVGLSFNKNGMPLITYTQNPDTKEFNIKYGAYVFTNKEKEFVSPGGYRPIEYVKDTIHVHNHPIPVAPSFADLFKFGSHSLHKGVVRPEQKATKNAMNEILKNKKNLLANYKSQIENSGFPIWRFVDGKDDPIFVKMIKHNDLEKKTVQNMYDFVKNINNKNLNKFVYFEASNLKNFHDDIVKYKNSNENKRLNITTKIKNEWLDNLYMTLPSYSRKYPTEIKSNDAIALLDTVKTNFALANKYKYIFEIKYA